MLGFLLGEALRDLRRAGRVALTAVVLITLSLVALGGFWLLSANLGRAVSEWKDRVRVILYLRREPTSLEQVVLLERVKAIPNVAGAGDVHRGSHAGDACPARGDGVHAPGRPAGIGDPAAAAAPGPHPGSAGSGALVAFVFNVTAAADIYTIWPDGSHERQVTSD